MVLIFSLTHDYMYTDFTTLNSIRPSLFSDSLDVNPCTFESNHRLCSYTVETEENTCRSQYKWRRGGGSLDSSSLRPHHDHTTQTESGTFSQFLCRLRQQKQIISMTLSLFCASSVL